MPAQEATTDNELIKLNQEFKKVVGKIASEMETDKERGRKIATHMREHGMNSQEAEAYQFYKDYRKSRKELKEYKTEARAERDEANESVYDVLDWRGTKSYKDAAAENVNTQKKKGLEKYRKAQDLIKIWKKRGYNKVYGDLTESDKFSFKKVNGDRSDIVESAILKKRLDPDDQKRLDWVETRPGSIERAIRDYPPGPDKDMLEQQWQLKEYRKLADTTKMLEEIGHASSLKNEDGGYTDFRLNNDHFSAVREKKIKEAKEKAAEAEKKRELEIEAARKRLAQKIEESKKGDTSKKDTGPTAAPPPSTAGNASPQTTQKTHDEEKGWVKNSQGTTKLIHTKDSNGTVMLITEVDYDNQGNIIDKRVYPVSGQIAGHGDGGAITPLKIRT